MAALTVSDRMITAEEVEYEPRQLKLAQISKGVLLLVAGDYTSHTQALKALMPQWRGNPDIKPHSAAIAYGAALQAVRRRHAEDVILAPLGPNTDSFLAQQREMSELFVENITNQLQEFRGPDVAALVVGVDGGGVGHLYTIDSNGTVRAYDDVGFTAIGIGGPHARLSLMQSRYVNTWYFAPALAAAYIAKKAAETAPGVGKETDIQIIFRNGAGGPLWPALEKRLTKLYDDYTKRHAELIAEGISKLQEPLDATEIEEGTPAPQTGQDSGDASKRSGEAPGPSTQTRIEYTPQSPQRVPRSKSRSPSKNKN